MTGQPAAAFAMPANDQGSARLCLVPRAPQAHGRLRNPALRP